MRALKDRGWMWIALCALCALTRVGSAQTADGNLRGVVSDATGAVVRGAAVEVRRVDEGLVRTVNTDAHGGFVVVHLEPGEYVCRVAAKGFGVRQVEHVLVEVGETAELRVRLQVAAVTESVEVTAEAPGAVSAEETSGVETVIAERAIRGLPVNGRRWSSFALLAVGVDVDEAEGVAPSVRGLDSTQNDTTIDGVDDTQQFSGAARGGPRAAFTFTQEAVREFRVKTAAYGAEHGKAAGGVINTVTRRGGDALHGAAFFEYRDNSMGATNPFSIVTRYTDGVVTNGYVKPHDVRQQWGGALGGPVRGGLVRMGKAFYFVAYEQQLRSFPAVSSASDPSFFKLSLNQTAALQVRGVTLPKINDALNYLSSLMGEAPRRGDEVVVFPRMDWHVSDGHQVSAMYNHMRWKSPAGVRSSPVVNRGRASIGDDYVDVDVAVGRWVWLASASLSNEVRGQYGRDYEHEEAQAPLAQEPATGPGGFAPQVNIGGAFYFGKPASLGRRAYPDERRFQVADTATWVRGRNLVTAGGDWSRVSEFTDSLPGEGGSYNYDGAYTGLVDWITDFTFDVNAYPNGGCPSIFATVHYFCFRSFSQGIGQTATKFAVHEWAGFVQDDWKVRENLTAHVGFRYDYLGMPRAQAANAALDAAFADVGATSVLPRDANNFAPRVGVSWGVTKKTVVRAGYGLFYGRVPGATIRAALVNTATPGGAYHVRVTAKTEGASVATTLNYPRTFLTMPASAVMQTTSAMMFDRRFRAPMVQQGNLAVEREVRGVTLTAGYVMGLARQLPDSVDVNVAPATGVAKFQLVGGTGAVGVRDGEGFVVPLYTARRNAAFGPMTDIESNATGTYHALVVGARRRMVRGLEVRGSWTWSKALDFGQNTGAVPQQDGQFDPFTDRYDKALSSVNHPHKVSVAVVWDTRVKGDAWWRKASNGWDLSAIFLETSGRPYSLNIFGGTRLAGGRETINGSGGAVYLPTVGRNTMRLPETQNVDFRVARSWLALDKVRVRGTVEVFNAFNHQNLSGAEQRAYVVGTAANGLPPVGAVTFLKFQDSAAVAGTSRRPFGAATEAASSLIRERQVQMGVRMEF